MISSIFVVSFSCKEKYPFSPLKTLFFFEFTSASFKIKGEWGALFILVDTNKIVR